MKPYFKRIKHSLLLGGSIVAGSMTSALAGEALEGQQIAMYKPASSLASPLPITRLTAEKMLSMANKISSEQMSATQEELAFALIYSAANKGLAEAQFKLANYYMDSEVVAADEDKAIYWLTQAIDQDHQGAKFVYENLYENFIDIGC